MISERNLGWSLEIHKSARKLLRKLPRDLAAIEDLPVNPFPVGTQALKGFSHVYRVRVGDYRIVYPLDQKARHIRVTHIGHRKHVYRNL